MTEHCSLSLLTNHPVTEHNLFQTFKQKTTNKNPALTRGTGDYSCVSSQFIYLQSHMTRNLQSSVSGDLFVNIRTSFTLPKLGNVGLMAGL